MGHVRQECLFTSRGLKGDRVGARENGNSPRTG
jgi:hypothetical protein